MVSEARQDISQTTQPVAADSRGSWLEWIRELVARDPIVWAVVLILGLTYFAVGGRYDMLCFSDRQPGDRGPRRVTQDEIRTAFSEGWRVDIIEPAVIDVTYDPAGALAWQVAATRI